MTKSKRAYADGQIDLFFESPDHAPIKRTVHPDARYATIDSLREKGYNLVREQPHLRELHPSSGKRSDEISTEA